MAKPPVHRPYADTFYVLRVAAFARGRWKEAIFELVAFFITGRLIYPYRSRRIYYKRLLRPEYRPYQQAGETYRSKYNQAAMDHCMAFLFEHGRRRNWFF